MEKKEIAIGTPIAVRGLTIIPVVEVLMTHCHARGITSFSGVKQPVAVIVASPSDKRAFRITGEETSIEQLVQESPGIKEALEGLQLS